MAARPLVMDSQIIQALLAASTAMHTLPTARRVNAATNRTQGLRVMNTQSCHWHAAARLPRKLSVQSQLVCVM